MPRVDAYPAQARQPRRISRSRSSAPRASIAADGFRPHLDAQAASAVRRHAEAFAPQAITLFRHPRRLAARPGYRSTTHRLARRPQFRDVSSITRSMPLVKNPLRAVHLPSNWLSCLGWRRLYAQVLRGADQVIVASHSSEARAGAARRDGRVRTLPLADRNSGPNGPRPCRRSRRFSFSDQLTGLGFALGVPFLDGQGPFRCCASAGGKGGFRIMLGRGAAKPTRTGSSPAIAGKPEIEAARFRRRTSTAWLAICHAVPRADRRTRRQSQPHPHRQWAMRKPGHRACQYRARQSGSHRRREPAISPRIPGAS